jgi:hypothetical protein
VFTSTGQTRATGVWYHLDVSIKYNGAGAVSEITMKVDGTTYVNASTFNLKQGLFDQVNIGAEHPNQYVDLDADDVFIDTSPLGGSVTRTGSFTADAEISAVPGGSGFTSTAARPAKARGAATKPASNS